MTKKQKQQIVDYIANQADELEIKLHFLGVHPTDFAEAIIGATFTLNQPHVVYDYEKTLEVFMRDNKWSRDEAIEWFDYNVERGLPFFKNAPIFVEVVKP